MLPQTTWYEIIPPEKNLKLHSKGKIQLENGPKTRMDLPPKRSHTRQTGTQKDVQHHEPRSGR